MNQIELSGTQITEQISSTVADIDVYAVRNGTPKNSLRIRLTDSWLIVIPEEDTEDTRKQKRHEPKEVTKLPIRISQRLTDLRYGHETLDYNLQEMSQYTPSIEEVWRITQNLPSLSKLILEERNNE
jgi:hypothetical protein